MTNLKLVNIGLRDIPSVDEILKQIDISIYSSPRKLILKTIRQTLNSVRKQIVNGTQLTESEIISKINNDLDLFVASKLKNVINGTGIVLHTGLGRAPISKELLNRVVDKVSGYANIELDLSTGKRGERNSHVDFLINSLVGSESSLVVNNNAAAVLLILNSISKSKEVIISRGQQVEIGGSFRIPDVIQKSDCKMIEVGTTNKTHLIDYKNAINKNTGAILVAHTSNYKVMGFTEEVELTDLASLAKKHRIPLLVDLGSGAIADFNHYKLPIEPQVHSIIKQGADIVTFSGDKLLGGPQAGIIAGKKKYIRKIHQNALYRALRVDVFIIALLEEILRTYTSSVNIDISNLSMTLLKRDRKELNGIANKIVSKAKSSIQQNIKTIDSEVEAGSGSLPLEKLKSVALVISSEKHKSTELSFSFRTAKYPILGYIRGKKFIIDLKAVNESQIDDIVTNLNEILS
jgi:L-seryl-tRNA(Ser) seleniumtransferase